MNKAELIQSIRPNFRTLAEATLAVDAVLEGLSNALTSGENVVIVNFGSFKCVTRAEKQGRNPMTGEMMTIPEKKTVKFVPGKWLKKAL